MEESTSRRSSTEIIDAIYDALEVQTYRPVSHIAEASGLDWKTTKRYLDLILHIQSKQKGSWLRMMEPSRGGPIYARERK